MKESSVKVLVRAFGDEPVCLHAVSHEGGRVEVIGSDAGRSLRFPEEYVYSYDENRYAALRQAFEMGDREALAVLWQEIDGRD